VGGLHLVDDGLCGMGQAHPLGRDGEADQQFGRTRTRDRAGSTGRAGYSRAGEKLVCLFFIGALLVCGSLTHSRYEQQRTDDSAFNLTGWSYRVNAPHAEWASWGEAHQHFLGRGADRQCMERVPTLAVVPGLAIKIAVLAFNLFGDMLRDILDPRLRSGSG
jgi:hypothetical protein